MSTNVWSATVGLPESGVPVVHGCNPSPAGIDKSFEEALVQIQIDLASLVSDNSEKGVSRLYSGSRKASVSNASAHRRSSVLAKRHTESPMGMETISDANDVATDEFNIQGYSSSLSKFPSDTEFLCEYFQKQYSECIGQLRDRLLNLLSTVKEKLLASPEKDSEYHLAQCLCVGRASHSIALKVKSLHHLIFPNDVLHDVARKSRVSKTTRDEPGMFVFVWV